MKIIILILLFFAFFVSSCKDEKQTSEPEIGLRLGQRAPDFLTYDIDNKFLRLYDFRRNKVVLLHFWATWCPYSRNSIDNVKSLWDKYNSRNFQIISISRDYDLNALRNFISLYSLNWIHIHDTRYDVAQHYDVKIIPMCYLIDQNGIIKFANSPLEKNLDTIINNLTK